MSTIIDLNRIPATVNTGLFAQTANSVPITNTTVETTILNGGVGTLSVPANGFKVGDSFQATLSGALSAVNNNVIRLRTKSGSIVLGDTGPITLPGITNKIFDIHIVFTIRALGAAGTASIATSGQFTYSKDASNVFEGVDFLSINSTTFDTTISNTFDMTVQWETARVSNSISTEVFVLHKIY